MRKIAFTILIIFYAQVISAQTNILPTSGNIGIGTLQPVHALDIVGIMRWGNGGEYTYSGQDNGGGFIEQKGSAQHLSKLRFQSSKGGLGVNYSYLMIDPENGFSFNSYGNGNTNVGIGVAIPSEKLSVNGNIRAKEVKVEVANWPDYVFEDGYQLMSLQALDKYIAINKKLPEVPSAATAERDGIGLATMNKLLLKKIEELTLYLVKQDTRLTEQQQTIENYEKRLQQLEKK